MNSIVSFLYALSAYAAFFVTIFYAFGSERRDYRRRLSMLVRWRLSA